MKSQLIKFLFVCVIYIFALSKCEAQKQEAFKTLPLLTINNQKLNLLLDSIVTFSLKCEGKGINQLKFLMNFRDIDFITSVIYISLIDCQGLDWVLHSTDPRQEVFGYFEYRDQIFLVSGQVESTEIFKKTNSTKTFKFSESKYLLGKTYSEWFYTCSFGSDFKLLDYHPICDPNSIYPICNEIKTNNTKR